jgi:hypothetical protein
MLPVENHASVSHDGFPDAEPQFHIDAEETVRDSYDSRMSLKRQRDEMEGALDNDAPVMPLSQETVVSPSAEEKTDSEVSPTEKIQENKAPIEFEHELEKVKGDEVEGNNNSNNETNQPPPENEAAQGEDGEPKSKKVKKDFLWLFVIGNPCHSLKQVSSGIDLVHVKKKYRNMKCLYCEEFNPTTPWARLKPRKYEIDNLIDHEKSKHHEKALSARNAALGLPPHTGGSLSSSLHPSSSMVPSSFSLSSTSSHLPGDSGGTGLSIAGQLVTNNITKTLNLQLQQQIQHQLQRQQLNQQIQQQQQQQGGLHPHHRQPSSTLHPQQLQQLQQSLSYGQYPPQFYQPYPTPPFSQQHYGSQQQSSYANPAASSSSSQQQQQHDHQSIAAYHYWLSQQQHQHFLPTYYASLYSQEQQQQRQPQQPQQQTQQHQQYPQQPDIYYPQVISNQQTIGGGYLPPPAPGNTTTASSASVSAGQYLPHQHHALSVLPPAPPQTASVASASPPFHHYQPQQQQQSQQQSQPNTSSPRPTTPKQRTSSVSAVMSGSMGVMSSPRPGDQEGSNPENQTLAMGILNSTGGGDGAGGEVDDNNQTNIPIRPKGRYIPNWLIVQGKFCYSDRQVASGEDLRKTKKKYRQVMCQYCADYLPNTPWATLKARKFETAVFIEHERSINHKRAEDMKKQGLDPAVVRLNVEEGREEREREKRLLLSGGGVDRGRQPVNNRERNDYNHGEGGDQENDHPLLNDNYHRHRGNSVHSQHTSAAIPYHDHSSIVPSSSSFSLPEHYHSQYPSLDYHHHHHHPSHQQQESEPQELRQNDGIPLYHSPNGQRSSQELAIPSYSQHPHHHRLHPDMFEEEREEEEEDTGTGSDLLPSEELEEERDPPQPQATYSVDDYPSLISPSFDRMLDHHSEEGNEREEGEVEES